MDDARANQSHPKSPRANKSQLEPPKNHPESTRTSQSQPVANKNLYFILLFLVEHINFFELTIISYIFPNQYTKKAEQ